MAAAQPPIVRLLAPARAVGAPHLFAERVVPGPHEEARLARDEASLLARALDILANDSSAEERLAGLLILFAQTVGARRGAVLTGGPDRRVAVSVGHEEDTTQARNLADWLDQNAPRSRAERAATRRAPIAFVRATAEPRSIPSPDAVPCITLVTLHTPGGPELRPRRARVRDGRRGRRPRAGGASSTEHRPACCGHPRPRRRSGRPGGGARCVPSSRC